MSAPRKRLSRRTSPRRRPPHRLARPTGGQASRWLIAVLVIVAVLVILLRLAEFAGRGRTPRPHYAPTSFAPGSRAAASCLLPS